MKDLIQKLVKAPGPAGSEFTVASVIQAEIAAFADEMYTDVLGNLYAVKKPQTNALQFAKTVLITAHMDEPGITVVDIDQGGFLRIAPLGHLVAAELIGRRIKLVQSGVTGVIAAEQSGGTIEFSQLFVDIAATCQAEAEARVQIGDAAVFAYEFQEFNDRVVLGHALDNRIACAVATLALKKAPVLPYRLVVVFSAQQQVGARGIQVAGYRVDPDLAMVLDATPAGDTPKSSLPDLRLGKGVAIKALDAGMVVAPALRDHLIQLAEAEQIPYQIAVAPTAKSDAGTLQISRGGVPTCGLSLPMRYLHSPSQLAHLDDAEAMLLLTLKWLENGQVAN